MPAQTDPSFLRVARDVDVFRLRGATDERLLDEDRFLDFYTPEGIRHGILAYGLDERLRAVGLGDYEIAVTREDPFSHRLEIFVGTHRDDDHRILDLRVHLCEVEVPHRDGVHFAAMRIDWLTMQNPRLAFSALRPQLPGQVHPGTGLGRAMHNILVIMATRIGRDALVAVPAWQHLARLYQAGGYRFALDDENHRLYEVGVALSSLSFAAGAWAVERGFVRDAATGEVYRYRPAEMLLPLATTLRASLSAAADEVRVRVGATLVPRFVVDVDALRRSLRDDPVAGLDPDELGPRWF